MKIEYKLTPQQYINVLETAGSWWIGLPWPSSALLPNLAKITPDKCIYTQTDLKSILEGYETYELKQKLHDLEVRVNKLEQFARKIRVEKLYQKTRG